MQRQALWFALFCFLLGVAGFEVYALRLKRELATGARVRLLVTARDVVAGDRVTEEMLSSIELPERYLDGRRVRAEERNRVLGGRLTTSLQAGQGVVWSDVDSVASPERLALLVPFGRRAYALPTSANGLGVHLRPGDYVDVLLLSQGKSAPLVERVRALSVGGSLGGPVDGSKQQADRGESRVTVEVSASQADTLLGAEGRGTLRLVLRHPDDRTVTHVAPEAADPGTRSSGPTKQEVEHVR